MKQATKETDARIVIDNWLRQAGWDPVDKSQVLTEVTVGWSFGGIAYPGSDNRREVLRTADGDEVPTGRADYVLVDQRGRPLAVIEAKKKAIHPYVAKQQALPYAKQLKAPFIFLTNGELIYFWDYQNDDARIVNSFFSRRDMERLVEMRALRKPPATRAGWAASPSMSLRREARLGAGGKLIAARHGHRCTLPILPDRPLPVPLIMTRYTPAW